MTSEHFRNYGHHLFLRISADLTGRNGFNYPWQLLSRSPREKLSSEELDFNRTANGEIISMVILEDIFFSFLKETLEKAIIGFFKSHTLDELSNHDLPLSKNNLKELLNDIKIVLETLKIDYADYNEQSRYTSLKSIFLSNKSTENIISNAANDYEKIIRLCFSSLEHYTQHEFEPSQLISLFTNFIPAITISFITNYTIDYHSQFDNPSSKKLSKKETKLLIKSITKPTMIPIPHHNNTDADSYVKMIYTISVGYLRIMQSCKELSCSYSFIWFERNFGYFSYLYTSEEYTTVLNKICGFDFNNSSADYEKNGSTLSNQDLESQFSQMNYYYDISLLHTYYKKLKESNPSNKFIKDYIYEFNTYDEPHSFEKIIPFEKDWIKFKDIETYKNSNDIFLEHIRFRIIRPNLYFYNFLRYSQSNKQFYSYKCDKIECGDLTFIDVTFKKISGQIESNTLFYNNFQDNTLAPSYNFPKNDKDITIENGTIVSLNAASLINKAGNINSKKISIKNLSFGSAKLIGLELNLYNIKKHIKSFKGKLPEMFDEFVQMNIHDNNTSPNINVMHNLHLIYDNPSNKILKNYYLSGLALYFNSIIKGYLGENGTVSELDTKLPDSVSSASISIGCSGTCNPKNQARSCSGSINDHTADNIASDILEKSE